MDINDVDRIKVLERQLLMEQEARIEAEMGQCQSMVLIAQLKLPILKAELAQVHAKLAEAQKDGTPSN